MSKYYAVKIGKQPGIYTSWEECKEQVTGFKGAIYKSFATKEEAEDFMRKDKQTFGDEINFAEMETFAFVDGSFNETESLYGGGYFIYHKKQAEEEETTSFLEASVCGNNKDLISMRNVAGELLATKSAIIRATLYHQFKEIYIFFDYQGIQSWADGTWEANTLGTIAYQNFMKEMQEKIKIHFVKVKGHSNVIMNDYVDLLAKKGCHIDVKDKTFQETRRKLFKTLGMKVEEDDEE